MKFQRGVGKAAKARDRHLRQRLRRTAPGPHRLLLLQHRLGISINATARAHRSHEHLEPVVRHISSADEIPLTIINVGLSAAAAKAIAAQAERSNAFAPHIFYCCAVRQPSVLVSLPSLQAMANTTRSFRAPCESRRVCWNDFCPKLVDAWRINAKSTTGGYLHQGLVGACDASVERLHVQAQAKNSGAQASKCKGICNKEAGTNT